MEKAEKEYRKALCIINIIFSREYHIYITLKPSTRNENGAIV